MEELAEINYYQKRMDELGITPDVNHTTIWRYNSETRENEAVQVPIFRDNEKGIDIFISTIDGYAINVKKDGSRWSKDFCITRLEKPITSRKGDVIKYLIPKGAGTHPFFGPKLQAKYAAKEKIKTLVFTEGYFKSFKGEMAGLDIFGLSSITHFRDSQTGDLHGDIVKLIQACNPDVIVFLADGDCVNLTSKELTDGIDLYKRPRQFYQAAATFKDLFTRFDRKLVFAHINSRDIDGQPKGLDDLLCALPDCADEIVDDLITQGRKAGKYFTQIDCTFSVIKLNTHFNLNDIEKFVLYHSEYRPEILDIEFVYNGTRYKWNKTENKAEILVPKDAKNYFRVGDQYHRYVYIPNKYGDVERTFHRRQKSTIMDDHGKKIIEHIPKYQAFCNVPDHRNFQPVINDCFNVYAPFEHEPIEGEWPNIEAFLKHIFGNADLKWHDPLTQETMVINEYELGLDYLQLLYKEPTQILPILCLVSRENATGKSTLAKLLKLIFTANVAIVGNAELSDNFNASWASKLLIICDEAKIDKQIVVEKVKSLSTADKILMNSKGKDHVEIDFFGKFVFLTNNEENFIYASEDDVRYWIRKVHPIADSNLNVNILQTMHDEIPAFLHFLEQRNLITPKRHRAHFHPNLIKTDALKRVIAYSAPAVEKELKNRIREMFFTFGVNEIKMTIGDIKREFDFKRYEDYYMHQILEKLKVEPIHKLEIIEGKEIKRPTTARYSYPRYERKMVNDNGQMKEEIMRVDVKCPPGRPYVFTVEKFLTPEEIKARDIDPENRRANEIMDYKGNPILPLVEPKDDKLPF